MLIQRRRSGKKNSRWIRQLDMPIALQTRRERDLLVWMFYKTKRQRSWDRTISQYNMIFTGGVSETISFPSPLLALDGIGDRDDETTHLC
jgi:hypothetical protein